MSVSAPPDVEVHRQPHLLRRRPQLVPVPGAERRAAEEVRSLGEDDAPVPLGGAALHLGDRYVDVPERHRHDGDVPAGVGARVIDKEVVVGLDHLQGQLPVGAGHRGELAAAEAGNVGVEHSGVDAKAGS